jgi:hypothetical protein
MLLNLTYFKGNKNPSLYVIKGKILPLLRKLTKRKDIANYVVVIVLKLFFNRTKT